MDDEDNLVLDRTAEFLAFCRSKPTRRKYDYFDNCGCAYFQFLRDTGEPVAEVYGSSWQDKTGNERAIPDGIASPLCQAPYTFGALADRLTERLGK